MLGIAVSQATVSKHMLKNRKPPSQSWRAFLQNHVGETIKLDFLTVPTATFRVLFVFVVLSHKRQQILHHNVTAHPSAGWTVRQLVEACGFNNTPTYFLLERDGIYGDQFSRQATTLGLQEAMTAPRSPWQNGYVERVIGSICREYLDHVIVLRERQLMRVLHEYIDYYNRVGTHLSLDKDALEARNRTMSGAGRVVKFPRVGGLHHEYSRIAA